MDLPDGEELVRIHRLRTADGVPMVLEDSYLPKSPLRWLLEEELEDESLYRLLEDRGIEIVRAEEHLEATLIREAESELLTVPIGAPALLIERVAYTNQGEPIEYVKSVCRGDRYRFSTMMAKRRSRKGINSL